MTSKLSVLLIAPDAPPKNTAEAIQVRRILAELDKHVTGRLVTASTDTIGAWGQHDTTLELILKNFDTHTMSLPMHYLLCRVLMSHHLTRFHVPDSTIWITWMARSILRTLKNRPDIIYSRSCPLSAALLAYKLKQQLALPWIMHLSDPWAGSPHRIFHPRDKDDEAACFELADLITLTTKGQAEYYQGRYPDFGHKIIVSPNVMPNEEEMVARIGHLPKLVPDDRLRMVFAGSLYGTRSPQSLLEGINALRATRPEILKKLHVDFYGNAQEHCLAMLQQAPDVICYHGPVSFAEAYAAQYAADAILTIDADLQNPFCKHFLSCKVTDCLALGKPLFAITPKGSEAGRICSDGYGWAVDSSSPQEFAMRVTELIEKLHELRAAKPKVPPSYYKAENVVNDLVERMSDLVHKGVQ